MPSISPYLLPIFLLAGSNIFMTAAWYGHLRFKESPLLAAILVSWAIAFVEYCLAVPANRWGSAVYTTAQLKTMQEVAGNADVAALLASGWVTMEMVPQIPDFAAR